MAKVRAFLNVAVAAFALEPCYFTAFHNERLHFVATAMRILLVQFEDEICFSSGHGYVAFSCCEEDCGSYGGCRGDGDQGNCFGYHFFTLCVAVCYTDTICLFLDILQL